MGLRHLLAPRLLPLRAYVPPADAPAVKLDANESPWPLPDAAQQRLAEEIARLALHRYPDGAASKLRAVLAARLAAPAEDLILGVGSDEVIAILMTALSNPRIAGRAPAVLFPTPTFVMFGISATAHGAMPVGVPLDATWELDVSAMSTALVEHRPNLVFLASPNNPTGNTFDERRVRALVEADPECLFVIDGAYDVFAERSLAHLCEEYDNVALLGTLSKMGLAGARVGWCRLPQGLAEQVDKARQPYNLGSLAQSVALLALSELRPVFEEQIRAVVAERRRLATGLGGLAGITVYPSEANFLFLAVDGDADALASALLEEGIAIRSFHGMGGAMLGHVRVTVGTPAENDALLSAMPAAIDASRR